MPLLENVEIWHAKLDPKRPSDRFNKDNPTWELQIRTKDPAQAEQWRQLHLKPKAKNDEKTGEFLYWYVNLKRKSIKESGPDAGSPASPPEVKDGNLQDVDPSTIGNGSTANVRIFQYDYDKPSPGIASIIMGVQLLRHLVYTPKPRDDDFKGGIQTERIAMEEAPEDDGEIGPDDEHEAPAPAAQAVDEPAAAAVAPVVVAAPVVAPAVVAAPVVAPVVAPAAEVPSGF